jgi:hypothetical protein
MSEKPDHNAVARTANELAASHGLGAHRQARTLAETARNEGDTERQAFWTAVAEALSPRCSI